MVNRDYCYYKNEAIENFNLNGRLIEERVYGSGHINDTFLVVLDEGEGVVRRYILQRMNHEIFTNIHELMENIVGVTGFLRNKIIEQGGDPERETLNLVFTRDGKCLYKDRQGCFWRMYKFIENTTSYDRVKRPDDFYQSAVSFGRFQQLLADYPAGTLHETIKDFHNTVKRLEKLKLAVQEDTCHRVQFVQNEIDFIYAREAETGVLQRMLEHGQLPLRVTHNDTKLNNIMIDNITGKGICVIDLDTVMPGLAVNDFGDSIRFGASTAAEDEKDLTKVSCDMVLFKLYTRGFVEGCGGSLTKTEIELLPMGAKLMTLECGIRFLTDYLQGDTYFKIHRENQNLDRCRTQLKLVSDMEDKWEQMQDIVICTAFNKSCQAG